jgi:hypothetical protein
MDGGREKRRRRKSETNVDVVAGAAVRCLFVVLDLWYPSVTTVSLEGATQVDT